MNRAVRYKFFCRRPAGACVSIAMFGLILFCGFIETNAQVEEFETAPPPVTLASKAERDKLGAAKDVRQRTKLALEILTARLESAERSMAARDFNALYSELGFFQGVLADQIDFMVRSDNGSGRVLDSFKKLEIGLRLFTPRIETIRRELPSRYEPFVRSVGKYIRDARSRALAPLFGDTVVKNPNNQ